MGGRGSKSKADVRKTVILQTGKGSCGGWGGRRRCHSQTKVDNPAEVPVLQVGEMSSGIGQALYTR